MAVPPSSPDLPSGPNRRAEVVDRLARRLHFTMERFDPTEDETWEDLTEVQREFFRACVRELLLERDLVLAGLT